MILKKQKIERPSLQLNYYELRLYIHKTKTIKLSLSLKIINFNYRKMKTLFYKYIFKFVINLCPQIFCIVLGEQMN